MRLPDRYWWLWIVGACASVAGAVLIPYYIVTTLIPLGQQVNESSPIDVVLAIAGPIVMCGTTALCLAMAIQQRKRLHSRRAALRGDLDAMPPALVAPLPAEVQDVGEQPLVLAWRATRQTQVWTGCLITAVGALAVLILVATLAVLAWALVSDPLTFLARHPDERLNMLQLVAGVLVGVRGLFAFFRYLMPTYAGLPYGATASATGIAGRRQFGRRFAVRWDEMRLFEVEVPDLFAASNARTRCYRVYGARDYAEWRDNPQTYTDFAPADVTAAEMARRLAAMIALIHARTGLVPRTCNRGLRASEPAAAGPLSEAGG